MGNIKINKIRERGMADMKIIGITMGNPASIGPEITAKALADPSVYELSLIHIYMCIRDRD